MLRRPPRLSSAAAFVGAWTLIDYSGNRYVSEGRSDFPTGGYQFNFRQVVAPRRSFSIDLLRNRRGSTVQNIGPQQQLSAKLGLLLEVPHLLVLYANDRAETLRWLGQSRAAGRSHDSRLLLVRRRHAGLSLLRLADPPARALRDAVEPRAPKIETFTGRRVFTDGERTVELHSIGPTAHANEMVIFYFPKEKILF